MTKKVAIPGRACMGRWMFCSNPENKLNMVIGKFCRKEGCRYYTPPEGKK